MPSPDTQPASNVLVRFLPAIAWMGFIFTLSHQPTLPEVPGIASSQTSVLGHFAVYFVLAILLWWALGSLGISRRRRLVLAFAVSVLYGFSDEWHQSFVSGRDASLWDNAVDAIGAATGLVIIHRLRQTHALSDDRS